MLVNSRTALGSNIAFDPPLKLVGKGGRAHLSVPIARLYGSLRQEIFAAPGRITDTTRISDFGSEV